MLSIINILIAVLGMISYVLYKRKEIKKFVFINAVVLSFSAYYYITFFIRYGFDLISENQPYVQALLSDLGSFTGFSIFAIILSLIGLGISWRKKYGYLPAYLTIIILILASIFNSKYHLFLNYFISFFAGIGYMGLIGRKWALKSIKNLTILVIICGLLFSTISHITRISNIQPDTNVKKSLVWLKNNSNPKDIVLSHHTRGFWIEYYSQRPTYADNLVRYAPDLNDRLNKSNMIFYSRNLIYTDELLKASNIRYIYVDDEMKDGLVWEKENQGLLFLFRNNETFKNVYTHSGIEIWQYKK
jgi:hypothetical protein